MLILSRKSGESLVIDGRVIVKIIRTDGDTVKVGIEAPANIPVHRQEVYEEIQKANREAANQAPLAKLPSLVKPKNTSGSTPLKPANNQQQTNKAV
jgi:carbon storage regulator